MNHHPAAAIAPIRGVALASAAAVAVTAFASIPAAAPPTDPGTVLEWWDETGTAAAAIALLRVLAIAGALHVALVGSLAALSALVGLPRLARLFARGLPATLRRTLASATIAACTLAPGMAAAAGAERAPAPIVLFDIGSAAVDGDAVIPPAPTATQVEPPAASMPTAPPATPTDRWVVQRGDHLWSVAEATLAGSTSNDEMPSELAVARYWQRLIDENREVIGVDPDVIHPGTTLVLPAV